MKESELLRLVMDWLAANHIFALRMNTGAMKVDTRFIKFGVPGCADILAFSNETMMLSYTHMATCRYIIPTWIELKVGKNGQSDLQKSFQKQVEREGHRYSVCYSLECVQALFL
jgi:hypothetical protein